MQRIDHKVNHGCNDKLIRENQNSINNTSKIYLLHRRSTEKTINNFTLTLKNPQTPTKTTSADLKLHMQTVNINHKPYLSDPMYRLFKNKWRKKKNTKSRLPQCMQEKRV